MKGMRGYVLVLLFGYGYHKPDRLNQRVQTPQPPGLLRMGALRGGSVTLPQFLGPFQADELREPIMTKSRIRVRAGVRYS